MLEFPDDKFRSGDRFRIIHFVFYDIPDKIAGTLYSLGFKTRPQVAETPDHILLKMNFMGQTKLNQIRRVIPYVPNDKFTFVRCPHCEGTGLVRSSDDRDTV